MMPWAACLLAQAFGTRANPVQPTEAGSGGLADLLQLAAALVVMLVALKWLAPYVASKVQGRIRTPLGSSLRVEESAAFGAGLISVVTVRGRTLLLGSTPHSVTLLADLTEADRIEGARPEPFFEILDKADGAVPGNNPEGGGLEGSMTIEEALAVISQAQARLQSGGGASERIDRLIDDRP
jgi:flagellar biogenesis protein FliO